LIAPIQIKTDGEALKGFRETFKAVEAGRRVSRHEGVYFTSIEATRNLLTPNRLALLRAIRTKRPGSIYELAKITGRDLKNIQDALRLLESDTGSLGSATDAARGSPKSGSRRRFLRNLP
jgi:predicted transcriptional regulator